MEWRNRQQSNHVEDRRGSGGRGGGGGLIRGRGGRALGGLGLGGILIAVVITLLGGDPAQVMHQLPTANRRGHPQNPAPEGVRSAKEDEDAEFVKVVLKDTEDAWDQIFREQVAGSTYRYPTLVLFTGEVSSACGHQSAATGPFYCPGDQKLYIDLSFYGELKHEYGAPGDFAMAYVIAHEVGHHVQYLLGTSDEVHRLRSRLSKQEYNQVSVKMELQADFYAGVWAHYAQKMKDILENGDIEEALNAAQAIGDDRLQKKARGYAVPESFTHGTSAQRMRWYRLGYETGDLKKGDTFHARNL
jgi:uncharacterized protein